MLFLIIILIFSFSKKFIIGKLAVGNWKLEGKGGYKRYGTIMNIRNSQRLNFREVNKLTLGI